MPCKLDNGNLTGCKREFKESTRGMRGKFPRQKANESIFMNYVARRRNIEFEEIFVDAGNARLFAAVESERQRKNLPRRRKEGNTEYPLCVGRLRQMKRERERERVEKTRRKQSGGPRR